ncbi:hypothetical protein RHRU231_750129 [Rhodococcus ruber]|uniref:Uncharacterized protein n=1 Tax=Rhodococcus ruber TaxID=1830 RepID=A0A098BRC8_9NOCA|nr:hypothetical protein RHRU231_750129 [Rhodococcus ruber]
MRLLRRVSAEAVPVGPDAPHGTPPQRSNYIVMHSDSHTGETDTRSSGNRLPNSRFGGITHGSMPPRGDSIPARERAAAYETVRRRFPARPATVVGRCPVG